VEEEEYEKGARPPEQWIRAVLFEHNRRRERHWTPPLVWNDECYDHAKMQAQACMKAGRRLATNFVDSVSGMHGQNITGPITQEPPRVLGERPPPLVLLTHEPASAQRVIEEWFMEKQHYKYDKPCQTAAANRFTQMMWMGTTSVGMALSSDGKFCVANYFPQGNDPSGFAINVEPVHEGPPPWVVVPSPYPDSLLAWPLSPANWDRHDEVSAGIQEAQEHELTLGTATMLPGSSATSWAGSATILPGSSSASWAASSTASLGKNEQVSQ